MAEAIGLVVGALAGLLALAGVATTLLAARAVRRFADLEPVRAPALPASILRPLHGLAPGLEAALASTAAQDHAAPFEVLCAVRDPADPAAALAERVLGAAAVIRDGRVHGPNRKASQLANLAERARHPVLVAVDDDIAVPPHWLTAVTAPLADPQVGLVTCLYHGVPGMPGPWSRLGGLGLDWGFLPNAILGESLGRARGCYGATMALRAETLERLGGFRALAGLLADDHALGAAVRRLGLRVVVAPVVPAHLMAEPSLLALLRHELRWARTVRLLDIRGYAGMVATHPLPFAALAAALLPAALGLPLLGAALAARIGLAVTVDRRLLGLPLSAGRLALLPVRDALGFGIWLAGLARGTVVWQGRRYRMDPEGRMTEAGHGGFFRR
ncbi:MAG: bacteriohopanetetrol glucosamine biosynthesis glycosyltransferase HpnI [Acetobacteraceae bacterium]|nr:bacteriohopanetetrol glucosamine biosynthesis glycosyltransferase HpnI [Acetobacteraceae bacterium]